MNIFYFNIGVIDIVFIFVFFVKYKYCICEYMCIKKEINNIRIII